MILNTICPAPARLGWPDLDPELAALSHIPDLLAGQDAIRAWEYARALRAIQHWSAQHPGLGDGPRILDVGGAGSNFWQLLATCTSETIVIVDPAVPTPDGQVGTLHGPGRRMAVRTDLATFAARVTRQYDILTCISVIEHISTTELPRVFRAAASLLAPGGLFVLTTDYWDCEGPDTAHFSWMRDHIYNPESLRYMSKQVRAAGFETFGETDLTWHGPTVYDYSMATLAFLRKG